MPAMDECDNNTCLYSEQSWTAAYANIEDKSPAGLKAVLSDANRPSVMRAVALGRLIAANLGTAETLRCFRVSLEANNLRLRNIAFLDLKDWLLHRPVLPASKDVTETIQAAMLSMDTDVEWRVGPVRALLGDPTLLAECDTLLAEGQIDKARAQLGLMRTKAAYEVIKNRIWNKTQSFKAQLSSALLLASDGDLDVKDFLAEIISHPDGHEISDSEQMRAIVALTRLGDSSAREKMLELLESGALSYYDGYLVYCLKGFEWEDREMPSRVKKWVLKYC